VPYTLASGQIDALKILAYALSAGGYSYQASKRRAKGVKLALRRALSRLRKDQAANRPLQPASNGEF
jgi:hypothetical protein